MLCACQGLRGTVVYKTSVPFVGGRRTLPLPLSRVFTGYSLDSEPNADQRRVYNKRFTFTTTLLIFTTASRLYVESRPQRHVI